MASLKHYDVYKVIFYNIQSSVWVYGEEIGTWLISSYSYKNFDSDLSIQKYISNNDPFTSLTWDMQLKIDKNRHIQTFLKGKTEQGQLPTKEEWEALKVELKLLAL